MNLSMKNLSLVLAGAMIVAFAFSSCKKTHTCTCVVSGTSVVYPFTVKQTKKDATTSCNAMQVGGITCTLK